VCWFLTDVDNNDAAGGDAFRRLYYYDCAMSTVNTGSLFTCDLDALNCRPASLRASFICVSSLVVSQQQQRLYWSDVGLGMIASVALNDSSASVRSVRSVYCRHRYMKIITSTRGCILFQFEAENVYISVQQIYSG